MSDIVCIATNIRGCREIIVDRSTGFLYPPGNQTSLINLLGTLLDSYDILQGYKSLLGLSPRKSVIDKGFTSDQVISRYLSFYASLVG